MPSKEAVHAGAPVAGSPYTPAVRTGSLLFVSGQIGMNLETRKPLDGFEAQVEGAIAAVRRLVEAAGGTLENVVKTTCFLADIERFNEFNEIYKRHFNSDVKPARSTFQVARLPLDAEVEIEAIAALDG